MTITSTRHSPRRFMLQKSLRSRHPSLRPHYSSTVRSPASRHASPGRSVIQAYSVPEEDRSDCSPRRSPRQRQTPPPSQTDQTSPMREEDVSSSTSSFKDHLSTAHLTPGYLDLRLPSPLPSPRPSPPSPEGLGALPPSQSQGHAGMEDTHMTMTSWPSQEGNFPGENGPIASSTATITSPTTTTATATTTTTLQAPIPSYPGGGWYETQGMTSYPPQTHPWPLSTPTFSLPTPTLASTSPTAITAALNAMYGQPPRPMPLAPHMPTMDPFALSPFAFHTQGSLASLPEDIPHIPMEALHTQSIPSHIPISSSSFSPSIHQGHASQPPCSQAPNSQSPNPIRPSPRPRPRPRSELTKESMSPSSRRATLRVQFMDDLSRHMRDWSIGEQKASRRLVRLTFLPSSDPASVSTSPSGTPMVQCVSEIMHTPDSGDPPNTLTEAELSTGRDPSIPSALISCIYWADRDDYFITSVDILLLMEFLSSSEFPFEEKSRTRRNLEAYRPITVARRIPPTVPFFHLLMTYPEPRPRKIEKDIKIYRWADLPRAIPKIMARE